MLFKSLAAFTGLLALTNAIPTKRDSAHGPPTFPTDNKYTITENGRHGNGAGPHNITVGNVIRAFQIAQELGDLSKRQGYGTVSGAGLNWYSADFSSGAAGYADPYYYWCFSGPAYAFPEFTSWMNFYAMFDMNQATSMNLEESGPVQGAIWNAIVTISQNSLVDARFILAIIMQESTGNVYVPCTGNGNCGLMQAFAGSVSYNSADMQNSINQMVRDGVQGTTQGPGLVDWFIDWDYNYGVSMNTGGNPYYVARGYNSGSVDTSNLNNGFDSKASYVSDVANRLQGWNGNDDHGYRAACGWTD